MAFELPSVFSKELAASSMKIYTSFLNNLASAGYTTPESLVTNAALVAKHIKSVEPGDDTNSRHRRRFYISAIFWVIPESFKATANPYSRLFAESLPIATKLGPWRRK